VDKSEFLSKIEFEEVMRRLTLIFEADDCTEEEINFLIEKLDENGDGTVSKTEFERLINIVAKLVFPQPEEEVKTIVKKKRPTV
jgi:Ca2+-binding EF-hand superfamily protein